ncbi:MAG TPA: hypothetical protein VIE66_04505 [Methylocella sp.]|jgi:hypothetical protein
MSQVLNWLKNEQRRAVVAMIGGGLVAAIGGGWMAATFVIGHHKHKPSPFSSPVVEQKGIGIASGHVATIDAPVMINPSTRDIAPPISRQTEKFEGQQKKMAEQISRKKGVGIPPLLAVLVKMGEAGVTAEDIPKLLDAKAVELIKLRSMTDRLRDGRAELAGIAEEVQNLIDKGEFGAVGQTLTRGRELVRTQRVNASRDTAKILALAARVDDLQLAFRMGANKDGEAAALVAPFDSVMREGLLRRQASELYRQGEEFGDNEALAEAININRLLLTLTPRSTRSLRWANTQSHLGAALELLGERESRVAQLDEAVTAYREALKEKTRERDPLIGP